MGMSNKITAAAALTLRAYSSNKKRTQRAMDEARAILTPTERREVDAMVQGALRDVQTGVAILRAARAAGVIA